MKKYSNPLRAEKLTNLHLTAFVTAGNTILDYFLIIKFLGNGLDGRYMDIETTLKQRHSVVK